MAGLPRLRSQPRAGVPPVEGTGVEKHGFNQPDEPHNLGGGHGHIGGSDRILAVGA